MGKKTYDEILEEQAIPAIAIDENGIIFFVNEQFEVEYGWTENDLTGNVVTRILPPHMRDAHNLGFSRFLSTEESRIMDKEISLPMYCKDGSTSKTAHFITAKRINDKWHFAALIKPVRE